MSDKPMKYTEITDELGAELRRIRTEQNLTLVQVAEALNAQNHQISNVHLSRIETGQRRIDDELLEILCAFYQVDARTVAIRASEVHIEKLQASVPDAADPESSLSSQIESATLNLSEAGKQIAIKLLKYINDAENQNK